MAFPLIRLLINGKRFPKKRANKIALLNSIIVGAIFFIATAALSESATTWNAAPAFMYYWINKAILTDKHMDEADQVLSEEDIEKQKRRKKVKSIIEADKSRNIVVVSALGKRNKEDHKITDLLYLTGAHLKYGVDALSVFNIVKNIQPLMGWNGGKL